MTLTWSNVAAALVWAAAAALTAWLVTWPVRRRSFSWLMLSVTLTGTAASAGALLGAAHSMLLPTGDEPALVVLTLAAGVLALVGALAAARRVGREHRAVTDAVAELGLGRVPGQPRQRLGRDAQALQQQVYDTATALHESRERERALESSRRELVAWVSHDLRTPLAGLRAMTEALEDGLAPEPELYYKQILAAVQRLSAMVDDLFDLSRIQAGSVVRSTETVDLTELVSGCVSALQPLAAAKQLELTGRIEAGVTMSGNAVELNRALTNVVANAVRHTPDGGHIEVTLARRAGGELEISVRDECGGIADDVLPRVYDVGYRGAAARTPGADDGGAGLGLAITRGVIEAHQGTVTVRNTATGCRFAITLPRQ